MAIHKRLTQQDYQRAARKIGCEVAAVKAVVAVESAGSGYLSDGSGRPKILFEAHWFGKFTGYKFNRSHPNISSSRWNRSLYRRGAREYDRLEVARGLDSTAALKSASWGLFQIMGFNHRVSGFPTVDAFVSAMYSSEGGQLDAFINFIQSKNLGRFLIAKNWAAFAYRYNGAGYRQNRYDTKMAAAYARFKRTEVNAANRTPASRPVRRQVKRPSGTYTIRRGDTLGRIASIHTGGDLRRLLRLNPQIKNPNLIRVGQVIKVA